MIGTRQTGLPEFRIANLARDAHLLPQVQKVAETLLDEYSDRVESLINRWLTNKLDFGNV